MNKYQRLNSIETEDTEKVREFAQAMNEARELKRQLRLIEDLLNENQELYPLVWTTQEGVSKAISDLEDDHLKNIVPYLHSRGQTNARIRKEYINRFGETPALPEPINTDDFDF